MSYIDAIWDRDNDRVRVVERDPKKGRIYVDYPARYVFYYPDNKGKYKSIYGESLSKVTCKSFKEFAKEQKIHSGHRLFESDINASFRILEENYLGKDAPKLNVAFFDIEVDFDPERGYASPEDAFMPITAISVYLQWMETMVTLAIPPKGVKMEDAEKLVEEFPNTHLFESEGEMLDTFLKLIEDADIISGWNSEGYDIPYTVNRVTKVLSKEDTRRFCLWDQFTKKREY
jgi:DNA polymerase elongation subunit (family B)